jgi:hypothetical protein
MISESAIAEMMPRRSQVAAIIAAHENTTSPRVGK